MAFSANKPNGIFKGPNSYKTRSKSWTDAVTGGSQTYSSAMSDPPSHQPLDESDRSTSSANRSSQDHFAEEKEKSISGPFLTN
ncbi:hypothetical protein BD408DRAFT_437399 [Parasitella parasitica]|nr:hypothetical protein BD408DRAFT_437399 [Parasitella parasitica]